MKIPRLVLLPLLLAAFGWRLHNLDAQSLWRDEVDAIRFAVQPVEQTLGQFTLAGQNGLLYWLGLRPWFRIVGTSEYALRFPSTWFNIVAIVLIWQVSRVLIGPAAESTTAAARRDWLDRARQVLGNAPLLATILFALHPYQTWYSQEGKMYTLSTLLTLLATWLWWRGVAGKQTRRSWLLWTGYAVVVSIAMYSHLLMVLLIPLHALWFLLLWPQSRKRWRGYAGALAALTLPYLPMLVWQWDLLAGGIFRGEQYTRFAFTPLPEMLRELLLSQTWGFRDYNAEWLPLAPVFFLILAGVALGAGELRPRPEQLTLHDGQSDSSMPNQSETGRRDLPDCVPSAWQRLALLLTWIVAPIAMLYLISLVQPLFTPRYLAWIAPAVLMLTALGVRVVLSSASSRGGGTVFAAALAVYVIGLWLNIGWAQKTEATKFQLREAVQYVHERRESSDLLLLQIPHLEWAYRYYSSNQGVAPLFDSDARLANWLPGPFTNRFDNPAPSEQALAQQEIDTMANRARDAYTNEAWLILTEVDSWDRRRLAQGWFDENAELLDEQNFHGVSIRHYRVPPEP